jgi:hypothetical protein
MPQVGFEPTIPVFQRANTVHALDRAATVNHHVQIHLVAFAFSSILVIYFLARMVIFSIYVT